MNKPCILAIFGKSAAGKDTAKWYLNQYPSVKSILQWTTRPKRENEVQDKDYHFCTVEDFTKEMLSPKSMIEAAQYNNWFYGTPAKSINSNAINMGIFGKEALKCLIEEQNNYNIYFLEIVASDKTRLQRSLAREKNPNCHEICRRFLSDEQDWKEIDGIIRPEMEVMMQMDGENIESIYPFQNVIDKIKQTFGPFNLN